MALPPLNTVYYFDQLIDHNDPSKGTFKQRYWHSAQFYRPGGPIILFNAGEENAAPFTGYLTDSTLPGVIAERYGGSNIVLEHRFFGLSNPYPNLNEDSLQYLTVAQAIEDHIYFAKNVVLPQANATELGPDKTPWILMGGSYPGALVSWTMAAHPDVFWIGYASSAVVQAQLDFWQYFLPIAEHMPKNCSADVSAVIQHVDAVFNGNNETAQENLKTQLLGWGGYDNTFVAQYLRSPLWTWQNMQPYTGRGADFYRFCDTLEVKDGVAAPESGWGLDNALSAWGKYITSGPSAALKPPASPAADVDNPVDDWARSWTWMTCNELGYAQDGPPVGQPAGEPAIVSRLLTYQTERQTCNSRFPATFGDNHLPDIAGFNQRYQGWNVRLKRLFFANGRQDPWREITVSAVNSTTSSTDDQPIGLSNGFHCSDLVTASGSEPSVGNVQVQFIGYVDTWLPEWQPKQ